MDEARAPRLVGASMGRMRETPQVVRWVAGAIFAGLALAMAAAGFFALQAAYRAVLAEERELVVMDRQAEAVVELRARSRGGGRYPVLVLTERLVLRDGARTLRAQAMSDLDRTTFFTGAFLEEHQPGAKVWVTMARDGGSVELMTGGERKKAMGLGVLVLFIGWFAWMLWPLVAGRDIGQGMGWKFGAAALVLLSSAGYAIYQQNREQVPLRDTPRLPVRAVVKSMPLERALAEIQEKGVKWRPEVKGLFSDPVWYCEYEFAGRTWRAQSLGCQGPEGDHVEGRVNPNDPWDVLW